MIPQEEEDGLINLEGTVDLGVAKIKDYKLAQGPQQAYAIGIEYRNPKYWWVSATTNYLASNYANISTLTRTQSFYLESGNKSSFCRCYGRKCQPSIGPKAVGELLSSKSSRR
ncbi:hypothetical protein ACU8V7_13290 [Zobellia nedashkovskayae]